MTDTGQDKRRRWPLMVIGASAGAAVWSGWVGLGELVGFGIVHPLPGIWDDAQINTAITLPIGVEAYAVYALSVATSTTPVARAARRFAWTSSVAALLLGMAGQVAYHLMEAAGMTHAPWQIVAGVSCLPVIVLGAASVLWHLTHVTAVETVAVKAAAPATRRARQEATEPVTAQPKPSRVAVPRPPAVEATPVTVEEEQHDTGRPERRLASVPAEVDEALLARAHEIAAHMFNAGERVNRESFLKEMRSGRGDIPGTQLSGPLARAVWAAYQASRTIPGEATG